MKTCLPSPAEIQKQWQAACREKYSRYPDKFLTERCLIFDATGRNWIPFQLWPAQRETLAVLRYERHVVLLKARQLGFSWLVLGHALWQMLFRPAATVLIFSKRDDEAVELLDNRLREMHARLPDWLQEKSGKMDGKHDWLLANGSRAKAFPTTGGRSYTGSLAIIDEADYTPDLNKLLSAVKPTIDAGGQLILLSTADKDKPESPFKNIYRAAKVGQNDFRSIFYDWSARPDRSKEWYAKQRRDIQARTCALDDLHESYPATDTEALAARTQDKRLPLEWLQQCYAEQPAVDAPGAPSVPGLTVFVAPAAGRKYVLGADPAEGNPTSDDSALVVLDADSGEECASVASKFDMAVFAGHIAAVAGWYNEAAVLVERNNHGHAVLLDLNLQYPEVWKLADVDGKAGWNTTGKSKGILWSTAAETFREKQTILHSFATFNQLASIAGATNRAPDGQHDDRAIAYALALQAATCERRAPVPDVIHLSHIPEPEKPKYQEPARFPCVRAFPQLGGYQPWIEHDGQQYWMDTFKTEDQAAYALAFARRKLGLSALPFAEMPMPQDELDDSPEASGRIIAGIEKVVLAWLAQNRILR